MNHIYVLLLILAFTNATFAISIDKTHEEKIKKGNDIFYEQCLACEKEYNTKFSLCRIAEKKREKLQQIKPGEITSHPLFADSVKYADIIMEKIEKFPDYQKALVQAEKFNTDESWRIVHNIVYLHAREIIQEKSDFTFPSLSKEYTDMHEKLIDFAEANKTIDPEKNGPYLEALSFVIYHVKSMQDDYTQKA